MSKPLRPSRRLIALSSASLVLAACGGGGDGGADSGSAGDAAGDRGDVPAWCGPDEATLGLADGFGGNSWRIITAASGQDEAEKCPSITDYTYTDGQGDTQKAIADIQGMVAQGVNALVVFPDAGEAMLPALRSAYSADVVTIPYRVDPGGEAGVDYTQYIGLDAQNDGRNWGNWIMEILPDGGNVLFLSGPPGNSQGEQEAEGLHEVLEPTGKYTFIGEQPFEVTNWDPAQTQRVLTAAISQNEKIDVIVSDFGPSLVGALEVFEQSNRSIPPIATSDGNVLGCFWKEVSADNPDFKLYTIETGNDHVRLAVQHAVALATGGEPPSEESYQHEPFENSVSKEPNDVQCAEDLPGDIYLSAELPPEEQAELIQ